MATASSPATPAHEDLLSLLDGKQTGNDADAAMILGSLSPQEVMNMVTHDQRRAPPLALAAKQGWTMTIQSLLEARVSVNQGDGLWGRSAFWEAASFGHVAVLRCLLDAAADPHQSPSRGRPRGVTPLEMANKQNQLETGQWLYDYYMDPQMAT